jgi:opacity protein-like surface antigen
LACANGEPSVEPAPARTSGRFCERIIRARASVNPKRLGVAALLALACSPASRSSAQDSTARAPGLDQLQLTSFGGSDGRVYPSQVRPTSLYSVSADYGEFARDWRLMFGVSYWGSQFQDAVIQAFVDTLNHRRSDTTSASRIVASPVNVYDVTFSANARWAPHPAVFVAPFVDLGIAAHVINAEGKLISGTFVERAIDAVAAGVFAGAGLQVRPTRHFALELGARGDLLSDFRSAQIRAGVMYYFGHLRSMNP